MLNEHAYYIILRCACAVTIKLQNMLAKCVEQLLRKSKKQLGNSENYCRQNMLNVLGSQNNAKRIGTVYLLISVNITYTIFHALLDLNNLTHP